MDNKIKVVTLFTIAIILLSGCLNGQGTTNNTTVNESGNNLDTKEQSPDEEKENTNNNQSTINQSNVSTPEENKRQSLIDRLNNQSEFNEKQLQNASDSELSEIERRLNLPHQCKDRGQDGLEIPKSGDVRLYGETLNTRMLESMIHGKLQSVRERREPMAEPLKCDPKLRKIARQNSRILTMDETDFNPNNTVDKKYYDEEDKQGVPEFKVLEAASEVCRNPSIVETTWYYRNVLDQEKNTDQLTEKLDSHNDVFVDWKNLYGKETGYLTSSNPNSELHGTGVYIDRETGYMGMTNIVC